MEQLEEAIGPGHEHTDVNWQQGAAMPDDGGKCESRLKTGSRCMAFAVTTHLNFRGQARSALDLYKQVFGGEQLLMTYGAMGQSATAASPDHIIWGQVTAADGFRIMAFDVQAGRDYDAGKNAFFVSLRGSSADEVQERWSALVKEATIIQPIGPSPWSVLYGMLTDRFGITWVVDVARAAA